MFFTIINILLLFNMNPSPKTIFCDIDGTILKHHNNIVDNYQKVPEDLDNVINQIKQWERLNYKIILTTGRKECVRKRTEEQLQQIGIVYDELIMGLPNGKRILINDKKPNGVENTAYSINLVRNKGMNDVDLESKYVTIPDKYLFKKVEKPWGYEELIECNDNYVVKKLFFKQGNSCSIQYHELKAETMIVLSGKLKIYIGDDINNLDSKIYTSGDYVTIKPYTIHRAEALEDSLMIECSTNQLWDVVRLKDNYNRV